MNAAGVETFGQTLDGSAFARRIRSLEGQDGASTLAEVGLLDREQLQLETLQFLLVGVSVGEVGLLLNGVEIGAGAVVRNAILDKSVVVPPGAEIGVDPDADRARGFIVEDGLTVMGKGQPFGD